MVNRIEFPDRGRRSHTVRTKEMPCPIRLASSSRRAFRKTAFGARKGTTGGSSAVR
jgi:hypothetical protein